jgi:2-polyprenyl-3-methyl-5-hydroxy-6-metoxy-1,4-benzoquinol methylase
VFDKAKPLSGNILDVGTGEGHFALMLAKGGYYFTSIDVSEDKQHIAKLNLLYFGVEDHVDFRIANAEHLNFKDGGFDVIFSINVIHHLDVPFKVIDEFIRVATPNDLPL